MSGHLRYRLQVFAPGVQTTTGTVSFTIGSSQLAGVPQMGGQRVLPLEGRVESIPWSVDVVDASSFFTKKLSSTATGRMNLLGRLVRFQSALNSTVSSDYGTLQVGRLSDLNLNVQDQSYHVTFSDERFVERETDIFTVANNVALIPAGPINGFVNKPPLTPGNWYVEKISGNLVLLSLQGSTPPVNSSKIQQLILNDIKDGAIGGKTNVTAGNFRTVRWRNTGTSTDYEIAQFDTSSNNPAAVGYLPFPGIADQLRQRGVVLPLFVWLVWTASLPTVGTTIHGYVYAPTHEPTPDLPLLVGGTFSLFTAIAGKHPFQLVKDIYDGLYSATTSQKVRYSTAAFDKLTGNARYGQMWYRVTRSINMADFVEQRIYQPYAVVPLIDTQGRVAPTAITLPQSSAVSLATLVTLASSNVSGHPTFEHPSREAITAITAGWESYVNLGPKFGEFGTLNDFPADLMRLSTGNQRATSTSVSILGRRELRVAFPAVFTNRLGLSSIGTPQSVVALTSALAREVFDRFQDGPIWAKVPCLATVDQTTMGKVTQGQFVKLNIATFPNPVAPVAARGGVRIMQVMTREEQPTGPTFELLDAGPNLAATSSPTITLALSTLSSRHAIVGTIANVAPGARWEAYLARTSSTGASAPAANSTKWFVCAHGSTLTLTFTQGTLASKTRYYGRALAKQALRIRSNYSASTFKVTASIATPSGLASTGITGGAATVKWIVGSSLYPEQVMVDATTSATLGSSRVVANVAPMTTKYQLAALNLNTKHKWGVRHADAFGGFSAIATATVQTTTSYGTAPAPSGIAVLRSL